MRNQLREAIRNSGRSLRDIGRASGVGVGQLSRFVRGQRGLSLDAIDHLCRALRLTLSPEEDLVPGGEPPMLRRQPRRAFTLIELLVVIAIIATLVGLLLAGVMKTLAKIPEVQTRSEIAQMEVALAAFRSDFNVSDPPPSALVLREDLAYNMNNALEVQSAQWLKRLFGKNLGFGMNPVWIDWNGDGLQNGPWTLEGEFCLTFWLGGIPNSKANAGGAPYAGQGFDNNPVDPSAFTKPTGNPNAKKRGPYYEFRPSRLVPMVGGFFYYRDPWQVKPLPQPYLYYSTQGRSNGYGVGDCGSFNANGPYALSASTFTNASSYQIISAGADGKFGGGIWNPTTGATGAGGDDQANFSGSLLKAGQN